MYLKLYRLNAKPFQITTDPRFLWLGEKHSEALATLTYGILEDKGFLLLTGDVGTGKTALIKLLIKNINVSAIVATIPDPGLDPIDFFNLLSEEFHMDRQFASKGDFLIQFKQFLLKAYSSEKKVLLIIDEAQRLHHELLEQIRLLSNIELEHRKLINIFFVGQTEFNQTLMEERNKAVRQRITVHHHIEPLSEAETLQYIAHRLKVAGGRGEIFTHDAMRRIHLFSSGVPRLINIICDHALLTGYASGRSRIDAGMIRECEKELRLPEFKAIPAAPAAADAPQEGAAAPVASGRRIVLMLIFLLLAAFSALLVYQYRTDQPQRWATEEIAPQTYRGLSGKPTEESITEEPAAASLPQVAVAPSDSAPQAVSSEALAQNPFAKGKIIIFFPYNSNELTREAMAALDQIADFLTAHPDLKVAVRGYTDAAGVPSYNLSVSQFRANSIKSYLVGKGVASANLTAQGMGPKDPIASNETPSGREQNRRVEIELVP
ncbi:MAG: OmpA family protein [Desulfobacterales bacterium]|jgi:general secretion pathway protein A|nr:OmpA family protein [Desulfobacterales bacterium]